MTSRAKKCTTIGQLGALAVAIGLTGVATPATAQDLSEKSTQAIMEYAWSLVPQQFTKPDGKTIVVDRAKKNEIVVPIETAREIIRAGYRSAQAQVCKLEAEQFDNHSSMMRRETDKKKWTDQQLLYINQLHLTTIMLLSGQIRVVEQEGDKQARVRDPNQGTPVGTAKTCPPELAAKVKAEIAAYVKAGPPIRSAAAPAATPEKK